MTEYSMAHRVEFELSALKGDYEFDDQDLIDIQEQLDGYLWGLRKKVSYDNLADRDLIKRVRFKYFHFSAHMKRSYGLRPNKPNRVNGDRERVVNPG